MKFYIAFQNHEYSGSEYINGVSAYSLVSDGNLLTFSLVEWELVAYTENWLCNFKNKHIDSIIDEYQHMNLFYIQHCISLEFWF